MDVAAVGLGALESVIDDAHTRMWRRRVLWGGAALAATAIAVSLFLTVGGKPGTSSGLGRHSAAHHPPTVVLRWRLVTMFGPTPGFFGGITKPPGGADLSRRRVLLAESTTAGTARIWMAPDDAVRGRCAWLTIGTRVYGGVCRRALPPRRGLSETVPLSLRIAGRKVALVWGQVGADVTAVRLHIERSHGSGARGRTVDLRLSGHAFLYVFPGVPRRGTATLSASMRAS